MFQVGSYVRVNRPDTRFHGCVFQIDNLDTVPRYYTVYNVVNELRRDQEWTRTIRLDDGDDLQEIQPDDPAFPENLLDQPVYVAAKTKFSNGDLVQVNTPTGESFRARVYNVDVGEWELEECLAYVVRVEGAPELLGKVTRERWDWLTLIKHASEEPEDYVTGEPVSEDPMVQALYDNRAKQMGWVSWETYRNLGCFRTCDCCDRLFFKSSTWMRRINGDYVCNHCANEYYTTCDECGCTIHVQESFTTNDDQVLCFSCAESLGYLDRDEVIHAYSYKPRPIFHSHESTINSKSLFMGVELEVDGADCRESCAEDLICELDSESNLFYLKSDASLTNGGFEIVTHPCTLQYHQESFPWQDIIRIVKSYHFTSHDIGTCGLHVHVNRTALGDTVLQQDDTAAKITMIFDHFWHLFVRFSRRRRHSLSHYAYAPNAQIEANDTTFNAIKKSKDACTDHYCAINLSNRDTVEFRIFRGTLKYNTLIASLQLVSNVVELAKNNTVEQINNLEWQDVINVNRYPELIQYLEERQL